jgi:biopolymer transport protein ExbD
MGISAGGSSDFKSEMNVVPLIDIVLVLLIIFLVTMPVLMRTITVEVPRKLDDQVEISVTRQISLLVKADGSVIVHDGSTETSINRMDLAKTLRPLLDEKKTEKIVFVDFEDVIRWEEAVSVMDTIKGTARRGPDGRIAEDVKVGIKIRDDEHAHAP